MSRYALIVGINDYPANKLTGSVNDAEEVAKLLARHEDGSENFNFLLRAKGKIRKATLKSDIVRLFSRECDIALFYFSGHGSADHYGYHIVTSDAMPHDMGVPMTEILTIVNASPAQNKIIILDCCHAGGIDEMVQMSKGMTVRLCNGVTILSSSRAHEVSFEVNGHSVFTSLFTEALKGGAADLNGNTTPGSIYAFIDKVLGPEEQRPVFKTNVSEFISLRSVRPQVPPEVMNRLDEFFPHRDDVYPLDPSFEYTNDPAYEQMLRKPYHDPPNAVLFKQLQKLQSVGLVAPCDREHMYFAAMDSTGCRLTTLGKHYWKMMKAKKSKGGEVKTQK